MDDGPNATWYWKNHDESESETYNFIPFVGCSDGATGWHLHPDRKHDHVAHRVAYRQ
jgi:hypothetical protein